MALIFLFFLISLFLLKQLGKGPESTTTTSSIQNALKNHMQALKKGDNKPGVDKNDFQPA